MSRFLCSLLLLFLVTACNNKNETSSQKPTPDYFKVEVGLDNNGSYTVVNINSVKGLWENYVKQVLGSAKSIELTDFRIVKARAAGADAPLADNYMLISRTADGLTKAAALLELKGDKFYFLKEAENAIAYSVLVCAGQCSNGCDPIVVNAEGKQLLNCSECVDCNKIVGEIGE